MEGSPRFLFFSYEPRGDNLKILSQKCFLLGSSEPIEENYCHVSDCICLPVSWINLVISCFVDFLNISLTFINSPILELFRKSTKPEIMKFIRETGKQMQVICFNWLTAAKQQTLLWYNFQIVTPWLVGKKQNCWGPLHSLPFKDFTLKISKNFHRGLRSRLTNCRE